MATINDEILKIVNYELNNLPQPEVVYITKVYENETHINCKTKAGDVLDYIPVIANNPTVNNIGLLIVTADDSFIVISK